MQLSKFSKTPALKVSALTLPEKGHLLFIAFCVFREDDVHFLHISVVLRYRSFIDVIKCVVHINVPDSADVRFSSITVALLPSFARMEFQHQTNGNTRGTLNGVKTVKHIMQHYLLRATVACSRVAAKTRWPSHKLGFVGR